MKTGIENLVTVKRSWLKGRSAALLSHAAAVSAEGVHSASLLAEAGVRLKTLLGPEHGFFSTAGAGKKVKSSVHPSLRIPVYSLYGEHRTPTPDMLSGLDTIIIDFQNIPARPYTYLATMMNVMQAAADYGLEIIIADRPVPLPNTVDGPMLSPGFASFVAPANLPMCYAMTPAETALWIARYCGINPELKISPLSGYNREEYPLSGWPKWMRPSPGISSWNSALCYIATVFSEGLPVFNVFRGEALSFQAFSAPWLDAAAVADKCSSMDIKGLEFKPEPESRTVLLKVTNPRLFRPASAGISILHAIQSVHGSDRLWKDESSRPEFFDKLFGGSGTRRSLQKGTSPERIIAAWKTDLAAFRRQRMNILLYRRKKTK